VDFLFKVSLSGDGWEVAYFRNMDAIQIINKITTTTEIIPTTAPALNMPPITEQLLRHNRSKTIEGKYNFFILGFYFIISKQGIWF
jgi:hypothetical protein